MEELRLEQELGQVLELDLDQVALEQDLALGEPGLDFSRLEEPVLVLVQELVEVDVISVFCSIL